MAFRSDITVPIMTPTSSSSTSSPTAEDEAMRAILAEHNAESIAALAPAVPAHELDGLKAEAQAIVDAQKFTMRKAMKAHLDAELASLTRQIEQRARAREEALRMNEIVEEEIRVLESRYEMERRALGKKIEEMGK